MPVGAITALFGANPVLGFATGMLSLALLLRYLGSFVKNDTRSSAIDKANDLLIDRLQKDLERLLIRLDRIEKERNDLHDKAINNTAQIVLLNGKVEGLERERRELHAENVEVRTESAKLRAEIRELSGKCAHLEAEAFVTKRQTEMLHGLQDQLTDAANVREESTASTLAAIGDNTEITKVAAERANAAYKEANTVNQKIASIGLQAADGKPLAPNEPEGPAMKRDR